MNEPPIDPYKTPHPETSQFSELYAENQIETRVPSDFAGHTQMVVCGFGLYVFAWPILLSCWTPAPEVSIFPIIIALNGYRVTPKSFRQFPWTGLLCAIYPYRFFSPLARYEFGLNNAGFDVWFSFVFLMQLTTAGWGTYAALCIYQCNSAHRRQRTLHAQRSSQRDLE
ncbi:hypothetical protein [Rhodopirellula bahusiensis]|uniref:hypothetical protein n=1 Tax=Rhodopirellula bahusiensis TaxID=2014065 RepID=UPI003267884A